MNAPNPVAGLPRRLAAMFYDALQLVALLMIVTACFMPFTGGEAISWQRFPVLTVVHRFVVVATIVGFYGVFWTRRGQTLGMVSWRLRVERVDGSTLDWADSMRRIAAALLSWLPLGLGWLWALGGRVPRTWHDILSDTRVVVLPKKPRKADVAGGPSVGSAG